MRASFRPVHSQVRQTFLSFSPYIFYRPPAYRLHYPPPDAFRLCFIYKTNTVTLCRLHRTSEHLPFEQSQSEYQGRHFRTLLRHSTCRIISSPSYIIFILLFLFNLCLTFSVRNVSYDNQYDVMLLTFSDNLYLYPFYL